jgi:hypothetical protein
LGIKEDRIGSQGPQRIAALENKNKKTKKKKQNKMIMMILIMSR